MSEDLTPERILNSKQAEDGTTLYYVKWVGRPESEATWVAESRLQDHALLVEAFVTGSEVIDFDKILARRVDNGVVFYHVLWKDGASTWEPRQNMVGSLDVILAFERNAAKRVLDVRVALLGRDRHELWIKLLWEMPDRSTYHSWVTVDSVPGVRSLLRRWMEASPDQAQALRNVLDPVLREASPSYGASSYARAETYHDDDLPVPRDELTPEEVEQLKKAYSELGGVWSKIAQRVKRSEVQCQILWERYGADPRAADVKSILNFIPLYSSAQLKDELLLRGIDPSGSKPELVARLRALGCADWLDEEKALLIEAVEQHHRSAEAISQLLRSKSFMRSPLEVENAAIVFCDVQLVAGRGQALRSPTAASHGASPSGRPVSTKRVGAEFKKPDAQAPADSPSVAAASLDVGEELPAAVMRFLVGRRRNDETGLIEYQCKWAKNGPRVWLDVVEIAERWGMPAVRQIELYDATNDVQFDLEAVVDDRVNASGLGEYLVQWKDYPDPFNRWETEDCLGGRINLVNEYGVRKRSTGSGHMPNPVRLVGPPKRTRWPPKGNAVPAAAASTRKAKRSIGSEHEEEEDNDPATAASTRKAKRSIGSDHEEEDNDPATAASTRKAKRSSSSIIISSSSSSSSDHEVEDFNDGAFIQDDDADSDVNSVDLAKGAPRRSSLPASAAKLAQGRRLSEPGDASAVCLVCHHKAKNARGLNLHMAKAHRDGAKRTADVAAKEEQGAPKKAKADSAKADSAKADSAKADSAKADSAKAANKHRAENAKADGPMKLVSDHDAFEDADGADSDGSDGEQPSGKRGASSKRKSATKAQSAKAAATPTPVAKVATPNDAGRGKKPVTPASVGRGKGASVAKKDSVAPPEPPKETPKRGRKKATTTPKSQEEGTGAAAPAAAAKQAESTPKAAITKKAKKAVDVAVGARERCMKLAEWPAMSVALRSHVSPKEVDAMESKHNKLTIMLGDALRAPSTMGASVWVPKLLKKLISAAGAKAALFTLLICEMWLASGVEPWLGRQVSDDARALNALALAKLEPVLRMHGGQIKTDLSQVAEAVRAIQGAD